MIKVINGVFDISTPVERARVANFGDEEIYLKAFLSRISIGTTVCDVGSCIGLYAIEASLKGAKVFAFEPDPDFVERIKLNAQINNVKDLEIFNVAITNHVGKANLYTNGVGGNSPSLIPNSNRRSIIVPTTPLNKLCDIVKIDVEGAEILVIKGMEKILESEKAPKYLFVEIHPEFIKSFGSTAEECNDLILSYPYIRLYMQKRRSQLLSIYRRIPYDRVFV